MTLPLEDILVVRPRLIDDVLVNPGMGFVTFQRFNGDALNEGKTWTEGFPIEYQAWEGQFETPGHPSTSIAYFRLYWRFLEPVQGQYRWDLLDQALAVARQRRQALMLRIAPHGTVDAEDVPDWYRRLIGPRKKERLDEDKWMIDPEDSRYLEHFGAMIRAVGRRYDGHPDLESVDLAIVGAWGEGEGTDLLKPATMQALMDCYLDTFRETPLLMLLYDKASHAYGLSRANVGYRADCLGDMRPGAPHEADWKLFETNHWSHMLDMYPRMIIETGMQDAWKKAPVSFEVCWVVQHWVDMGWDIDYIIEQSLKWHISTFNAKSSPIPAEIQPKIERWLKKMGYRLAMRRLSYPRRTRAGAAMPFTSWWENRGVAPCYKPFKFAFKLENALGSLILPTDANPSIWLPGDSLYDSQVTIPASTPAGQYFLKVGLVDRENLTPRVRLANEGRDAGGWYEVGEIEIGHQ